MLILTEKVNKNDRLPLQRLYGRRIFKNHEYKEGVLKNRVAHFTKEG